MIAIAGFSGVEARPDRAHAKSVPLPAPVPFAAPVFISDCATPLAGETVLSLLWRRLDANE